MSKKNIIDPTDINIAGNTDYENFSIYVDLIAERRAGTSIAPDGVTSIAGGKFNLMGYKQDIKGDIKNKIFTTDYTEVYRNQTNQTGYYEGFGITNISIEVNSSYVPTIKMEFVDIKGMTFLNNRENSPYSVLIDFPPPIFTLTVKGYYGYALEYKLHMLRHNIRFEAETGNYYISAEFVGNTFAPLADILYHYVLEISTINAKENDVNPTSEVKNLKELVQRSKNIKDEINNKLKENIEDINKIITDLNIITDILYKEIELKNNIKFIERPLNIDGSNKLFIFDHSFILNNYNPQSKYYLFIPIKKTNNFGLNITQKESNDLINFYKENFVNNKNYEYFNLTQNSTITPIFSFNGKIGITQVYEESPIYYIEITDLYKNIADIYEKKSNKYNEKEVILSEKTKEIVINSLGFIPTVKNVMEIICNDIDNWVKKLGTTYNESTDNFNNNPNILSNFKKTYNNNEEDFKLYPFPDFFGVEGSRRVKTIPNGRQFNNMPEVKLVDDFIDSFIQGKKAKKNEAINTDTVRDNNGSNIWYPINPLDSTYINISNNSPYNNLTTPQDVIRKIFARYYVYNYFTLTSSNTNNQIFPNTIANFFENEFTNIINTINQKKTLEALKNLNNISKRDFKQNLINYLENNIIKKEDIQLILSGNTNVSSFTDFSGIEFTSNPIIINNNFDLNIIKKGNFDIYLNIEPYNNYINENRTLILNNDIYKIKILNSDGIGLTLNDKNNIVFYDGNEIERTSFESFDDGNFLRFLKIKQSGIIDISFDLQTSKTYVNNIILSSINIKKDGNKLIYNNYKNNDNYEKIFGYLNIIYVPNLKHIISVLMNKTNIVQMPFLVKLYISSYVYMIKNNLLSDTNDFILDTLKIYKNSDLNNNHLNIRKDFIKLLNNLTDSDKDKFIEFYKDSVSNLIPQFESLIDIFNNKDIFKDIDIIEEGIPDIIESDIIDLNLLTILKEKTVIINKSNYTFSNKTSFNIFDNFNIQELINQNIDDNFKISQFTTSFSGLFTKFANKLDERINNLQNQNENELSRKSFQQIRTETYYSLKNFVDRWFPINGSEKINTGKGFLFIENDEKNSETSLFNLFTFVNRWYDNSEAENIIIDTSILAEFENDYNVNMLTVIGRLLNDNGFEFYPLQNFIDYTKIENSQNWDSNVVFQKVVNARTKVFKTPRFTCMYIGGKSRYLDSGSNTNNSFKNDGFNFEALPEDLSNSKGNKWFGFLVKFGDGRQSIFSQIEFNTEEHQPTNESLSAMSQIMDNGELTASPSYQNLYSTYEQRSYTCKVKMFGNVMIQPTQMFDLRNVPMFSGAYIILKVNHIIDGETNSMVTEFEGVRLPKNTTPFVTNPYEVYGKNLLKDLDDLNIRGRRLNVPVSGVTEKSLKRDNRKIYLVAGHDNEDLGAVSLNLSENKLNIELRNLIQQYLNINNINNEIDDDNKNLNQVVNYLEGVVQPNDLVIDIHFNAGAPDNAQGTEVFINNASNQYHVDLGEKFVNAISESLGNIKKRKSSNNLPSGVKLRGESYIEASGRSNLLIFEVLSPKTNVILLEICFITNKTEMSLYEQNKKTLAKAIGDVIIGTTITESDKELLDIQTYGILNQLKYDKIEGIINSFNINKIQIKNFAISRLKNDYYNYKGNIATIFKDLSISKSDYMDIILNQVELTSNKYGLDPIFLSGILSIESDVFHPSATSNTGALGISQFTSIAFVDVFQYMQRNGNTSTNVYILNKNTNLFESINIKYSDIILVLFGGKNYDFNQYDKSRFENELRRLIINNVYNNPFIMIELAGILLNKINSRNTNINKNMAISAISYNMGPVTFDYDQNSEKPYFENLRAKYNSSNATQNIKNKIVRKVKNEGIEYPERLIKEFIVKLDFLKTNLFKNENIV
jgi:N-acetylmuramoyl-L-alanine amidase